MAPCLNRKNYGKTALVAVRPAQPVASIMFSLSAFPVRAARTTVSVCALLIASTAGAQRPEALWYVRGEESIKAFVEHADQISIVSPQVFSLDSNGVIRGRVDPRIIAAAKAKKVKVVPLFLNPGFDQPSFHRVLNSQAAWRKAISSLVALCKENGFDGLQYDVENVHVSDKDLFTKFVRESVD